MTLEKEPELAKAIKISNRKRAHQDDSVHGIIHRLFSAIRLKDMPETVQNLYELMNHGFVRRTLHTNHYPYRHHFPDLQGAMPAILLEMCVFSEPGTVEFLPAMPGSLKFGILEGVWLYAWVKLEHMKWDENRLPAKLLSKQAQTLTLRCRRPGASFRMNGRDVAAEGDHICYRFSEGEMADIEVTF